MPSICLPLLILALSQAPPDGNAADDATVRAMLDAHNAERARRGKPPLKLSDTLNRAAEVHARDMATNHFMAHEGSDKSEPSERVKRVGYHYLLTGENVARGQRTVPEVMKAWMDSPKHKDNILGDYTEMGGAVVLSDDGRKYWAAEFGTPMPKLLPAEASQAFMDALNDARAKNEPTLKPLKPAAALGRSAQAYATEMSRLDTLQPDKEQVPDADPDTLVKSLADDRYRIRKLSRAILSGTPTAPETLKSLLANEANRADLMNPAFQDIGVGYAFNDKTGRPYWCVLLGRR